MSCEVTSKTPPLSQTFTVALVARSPPPPTALSLALMRKSYDLGTKDSVSQVAPGYGSDCVNSPDKTELNLGK